MRYLLPFVAFLLPSLVFAQVQSATTAATQDPQAVNIFNQALDAAGGAKAHKAVTDYTGSGTITYHGHSDVQGTVKIAGLGNIALRLDATLPTGVRSSAIHDGVSATKLENGPPSVAVKNRKVPSSDAFPYQTPLFPSSIAFPYRQLTSVLANSSFGISYKGMTRVDGHSVVDIQIQRSAGRVDPMSQYHTRDFFIDTMTFEIVMTRDLVPQEHHPRSSLF